MRHVGQPSEQRWAGYTGKGTPRAKVQRVQGLEEGRKLGPCPGPPGCDGDASKCEEELVVGPESCLHLVQDGSGGLGGVWTMEG